MIDLTFELPDATRIAAMFKMSYQRIPKILDDSLGKVAMEFSTLVKKGIRSQAPGGKKFKPLAESTRLAKKSSKALIHHGDLLNSVKAQKVSGGSVPAWFVGVHRSAKGKDGETLANIAVIHEFGTDPYEIPITGKMRRFWTAMVIKGVFSGTLHPLQSAIQHPGIPARPFLRPSYDEWAKTAADRWRAYVERDLLRAWKR